MAETRFEGGFDLRTVTTYGYFGQRFFGTHGITHPIETIQMRISKTSTALSPMTLGVWIGAGANAVFHSSVDVDVSGAVGRQWVSGTLATPVPASAIAGILFEVRLYHRSTGAAINYTGEFNASATYPNSAHIHGTSSVHNIVVGDGSNFILSGTETVAGPAVKRWDGSQWVTASVKRWDGSQWVVPTSFTRY